MLTLTPFFSPMMPNSAVAALRCSLTSHRPSSSAMRSLSSLERSRMPDRICSSPSEDCRMVSASQRCSSERGVSRRRSATVMTPGGRGVEGERGGERGGEEEEAVMVVRKALG